MKKLTLLLTLLALTLTACGASASSTADTTSQTGANAQTLTGPSMLAIGTLKLKDTDQAVTAKQAADLLPLWQVYQSLTSSDTSAQEEIDALAQQIQDVMTDAQLQAIVDMNLTPQDMFAVMQEMGVTMNRPTGSGDSNSNDSANFMPGAGGPPPDMGAGGPPAGGMPGQGQGGTGLSPDQIATAQASRASGGGPGGGPNFVSPALLEALIQYLQEAAGS